MLQKTITLSRDIVGRGHHAVSLARGDALSDVFRTGASGGAVFGWITLGIFVLATAGIVIYSIIKLTQLNRAAILEPLKKRYVSDEISEEEFTAKKAILLKK